jgi:hypothetical protein
MVPVDIVVKKSGDPDPASSFSATNGVLVQTGTTLDIKFNDNPSGFPLPNSALTWYCRQLKETGSSEHDANSDDYFTAWQSIGQGPEISYIASAGGIFQVKATLVTQTGTNDYFYVRKRDALNATDSLNQYQSIDKAGQPDYFGVVDNAWQIGVRNAAHSCLGSSAYAQSVSLLLYTGGPTLPGASTFHRGADKCNAFVYQQATAGGATVPLSNNPHPWLQYLGATYLYPPSAYNWWNNAYSVTGWSGSMQSGSAYPEPGYIVAGPHEEPPGTHPYGHCGILDYDGAWINAGKNTVNKFPQISVTYTLPFQPLGMRKYIVP